MMNNMSKDVSEAVERLKQQQVAREAVHNPQVRPGEMQPSPFFHQRGIPATGRSGGTMQNPPPGLAGGVNSGELGMPWAGHFGAVRRD